MEKMFIRSIVVSVILSLVFTVVSTGIGSLFEGVKVIGSFDAKGLLQVAVAAVLFAVAWKIMKSSGSRKLLVTQMNGGNQMDDDLELREWIDRVMPWFVSFVVVGTLCFFLSGLIYSLWMAYTAEVIEVLEKMKDITNPNAPPKDKWKGLIPFLLIVGLMAVLIAVLGSPFSNRRSKA